MPTITPCLWFDGKAEEAATFYASLLPDSRIDKVHRAPGNYLWRRKRRRWPGLGADDPASRRRAPEPRCSDTQSGTMITKPRATSHVPAAAAEVQCH
jgi:hypothetical protein